MNMNQIDTSYKRPKHRLTPESNGNDQLLYFTSPSLTADGRNLVFISDRTGHPNLFTRDLLTGEERQLTDNTEGFMKSYIYFDGTPYHGLGKASVSLDVHRGIVYYIQGRQICSVTLGGERRIIATYPAEQMTAYTHISEDGTRLCVPTIDARALDGNNRFVYKPEYDIDTRIRTEKLSSYIRIFDIATGNEIVCERIPQEWVTHVQFSPTDSSLLLYNSEWCSLDQGIRRLCIWDGKEHRRLRTEGGMRKRMDFVTHEMWERDGKAIIYHGRYITPIPESSRLLQFVGRVNPDGTDLVEIPLPVSWRRYGHFTVGKPGQLVTDGYYEEPQDVFPNEMAGGAWITFMNVDWTNRHIQWTPLCLSGSSWTSQDFHPHPIFNHPADAVLFTSDETGKRAVWQVAVPDINV